MSRCYPFPPPHYVRNKIRDECLIESIKGTKEEVKKDRKHKKKEKKRKERENEAGRSKKHRHKKRRKDEGANGNSPPNSEKSCLTMELELQTTPQKSRDSTLDNNERRKQIQSQPLNGRHNDSESSKRNGLHGKGQKDPQAEVLMTNKVQKQHERLDTPQVAAAAPRDSVGHPYSTSTNEAPQDALRVCQEKSRDQIFGSPRKIKRSKEKKMPSSSSCKHLEQEKPSCSHQQTTGPCKKCPPSMSAQFLNLIENWAPDGVESKITDSEDQEWWLFIKLGTNRQQVSNQITIQGSSSMEWPKARFLPEAEVHALPFAVPF